MKCYVPITICKYEKKLYLEKKMKKNLNFALGNMAYIRSSMNDFEHVKINMSNNNKYT